MMKQKEQLFQRVGFLVLIGFAVLCFSGCKKDQERLSSEELLDRAWANYRLGEFEQAVLSFERARQQTQERTPDHTQALYGLGTTWDLRRPGEDRERASGYYEQVINGTPDSRLAGWAALALARMQHLVPVSTEPDYDKVRTAYQRVIDLYPDHPAAEEATVFLYSTYASSQDEELLKMTLDALESFIQEHPDSGYLSAAYTLISECHNTLNNPDKEFDAKLTAFNKREVDASNPFYDNSWRYWNLATTAEFEVGDFDQARLYYNRLIEQYPQDIRVFGCREALKRIDRVEQQLLKKIRDEKS